MVLRRHISPSLRRTVDVAGRQRLRSSDVTTLVVPSTRRSTFGDRRTVPSQWSLQGPGTVCLRQSGPRRLIDFSSKIEDICRISASALCEVCYQKDISQDNTKSARSIPGTHF